MRFTVLDGSSRAVSRVAGAPPLTSPDATVPSGKSTTVQPGDEVVLFGAQGSEVVTAWDWAERLDTIAYEIVCGISVNRVPRRYLP
jgi:alanine racemase